MGETIVNNLARPNAALGAVAALVLLADALVRGSIDGRQIPLVILAAAGIAWFVRPGSLRALAIVVPLGVVLDLPFLTDGRGIYATEVVMLTAVSGWASRIALGRVAIPSRPPLAGMLLLGYGAVAALALLIGHPEMMSTYAFVRSLRVVLLAAAVSVVVQSPTDATADRERFIGLWTDASLAALALLAVGGLVEFAVSIAGRSAAEPGSFYRSSVGLANHIALVSPLALAWALSGAGRRRTMAAAAWIAAMLCLPLTASRGALGSVLITSAAVGWLMLQGGRRRWLLAAAGVLAAILVVLSVNPDLAGEAFAYKFRKSMEGDFFSTRVDAWSETGAAIADNPLTGAGPDAWAPSVPLELAARHGVPAALLALAALVVAACAAFRARARGPRSALDPTAVGVALGLAGFLLVGLAETGLGARTTPLLAVTVAVAGLLAVQKTGD